MLLLVFVTIYIYRKFSELAMEKDLNKTKWTLIGTGLYLGFGLGLPFFIGILLALLAAMGVYAVPFSFEDRGANLVISLVCYGIGGLAAYMAYKKLQSYPEKTIDIDNFASHDQRKED